MEEVKEKKEILKAIREVIANLALEIDSNYDKIDDEEIEKIYIKMIKEKKYGQF